MEGMDTWMPICILKKELEVKYMQIKFWGWSCSPADDPAARCAQNFINKAALWDYLYQFCPIFPHSVFFWYTPSLHFQVYDTHNKVKAAADPVWGSSAMKESPVSCSTSALGGEDRQKAWKKADSFHEQKQLLRVSSCFPTPSLHTALILPSQLCSPSPAPE